MAKPKPSVDDGERLERHEGLRAPMSVIELGALLRAQHFAPAEYVALRSKAKRLEATLLTQLRSLIQCPAAYTHRGLSTIFLDLVQPRACRLRKHISRF